MQAVISYIEEKRKACELHPFFSEFLSNRDLPGEKRMAWAPSIIPFIMGYADLNSYVLRRNEVGSTEDRLLQSMLNSHTYEEDYHWQWFLNDLNRLDADSTLTLSETARILWSDEFKHSRILSLELAALAMHSPTYVVYAMMEAIEALSITFFKSCLDVTLESGDECEFFGAKHYAAESSHTIHFTQEDESKLPELDDHRQQIARQAVDRVYTLYADWFNALHCYALKNNDHLDAYERMISRSKSMLPVISPGQKDLALAR